MEDASLESTLPSLFTSVAILSPSVREDSPPVDIFAYSTSVNEASFASILPSPVGSPKETSLTEDITVGVVTGSVVVSGAVVVSLVVVVVASLVFVVVIVFVVVAGDVVIVVAVVVVVDFSMATKGISFSFA